MPSMPDKPRRPLNIEKPISSFTLPAETPAVDVDPVLIIPQGDPEDPNSWPDRNEPIQGPMAPQAGAPEKVEHLLPPDATVPTAAPPVEAPGTLPTLASEVVQQADSQAVSPGGLQTPAESLSQIFASENTSPATPPEPLQPLQQPSSEAPSQLQHPETIVSPAPSQPLESLFNQPTDKALAVPDAPELNLPPRPALAKTEITHAPEAESLTLIEHQPPEPLPTEAVSAPDTTSSQPLAEAVVLAADVSEPAAPSVAPSAKPTPVTLLKKLNPFHSGHDKADAWQEQHQHRQDQQDLKQAA